MMPLTLADIGEEMTVGRIGGSPETKKHLENLGFSAGIPVTIVNRLAGNLIVRVRDTRIALSAELAQKIMVQGFAEGIILTKPSVETIERRQSI